MKNHIGNDHYSNVSFYVDLSNKIGYPLSIHINSFTHEKPLFWQSWSHDDLLESSSFLQGPGLPLAMLLTEAQLNSIPPAAFAIAQFNPDKQYQLLQSMLISPAAMQLALSNTALFMLLVRHAEQHQINEQAFKTLVLQKRTDILDSMHLPNSHSTVKMLARINMQQQYSAHLNALFEVLSAGDFIQDLRHTQHLCINHFVFLQRYQGLCWAGLLNMLDSQTSIADMGYLRRLAQDTCALGANLDSLRPTSSVAELKRVHDRYVITHNSISASARARQHQALYGQYPTPPLPGNSMIVPISNWHELAQEGLHMRHCVGAYHQRVYAGQVFIYQVLTQPRVTLSVRAQGYDWQLDEARGYANSTPSAEAMQLIHNWLHAANQNQQLLQRTQLNR